jgi:EAL domain-containing protein (putative c-di-GMP-specific phosphodiesterase class I)
MALIWKGESRYIIPPQTFISKAGESRSITELGNICLEDSYVTYLLEVRTVQSIKALVWATIFFSNTTFRPFMGVSETPN